MNRWYCTSCYKLQKNVPICKAQIIAISRYSDMTKPALFNEIPRPHTKKPELAVPVFDMLSN